MTSVPESGHRAGGGCALRNTAASGLPHRAAAFVVHGRARFERDVESPGARALTKRDVLEREEILLREQPDAIEDRAVDEHRAPADGEDVISTLGLEPVPPACTVPVS